MICLSVFIAHNYTATFDYLYIVRKKKFLFKNSLVTNINWDSKKTKSSHQKNQYHIKPLRSNIGAKQLGVINFPSAFFSPEIPLMHQQKKSQHRNLDNTWRKH